MPTVAKQTFKPPQAKAGSILSRAVDVASVRANYLKINIYGANRTGKTTLACTFPKPLLLISFEPADAGGAESVADVKGVRLLQEGKHFSGREGFLALVDELKPEPPYATVVLDSVTSMQDKFLAELLGLEKLPEQRSFSGVHKSFYLKRAEQLKEALRPFIALQSNLVILAKEKDHRPKDKDEMDFTPAFVRGVELGSYFASEVGGSVAGWIHDACPFICRLDLAQQTTIKKLKVAGKEIEQEVATGKIIRRLRLMYHPNFASGVRTLQSKELPEYLFEPTYEKLAALVL